MKNFTGKKVAVGVLAAILAAGTAVGGVSQIPYNVLADSIVGSDMKDQKGTLEITKTSSEKDDEGNYKKLAGAAFTLYKLMSITPGTNPGEFASYTKVTDFETALAGVTPDALGEYNAAQIEALASDLQGAITVSTPVITSDPTVEDEDEELNGKTTISDLDLGYYMVVETKTPAGAIASKPFFISVPTTNDEGTAWNYVIKTAPKNQMLTLDKDIVKTTDEGKTLEPSDTSKVGDIIPFKVTTSIPNYNENYTNPVFVIKDTMDDGLTIQNTTENPIKVTVDGNLITDSTDKYVLTVEDNRGEGKTTKPDLQIAFTEAFIKANLGKSVVVEYSAELNDDAVSGTTGNGNMAFLKYNNAPGEVVNSDDPDPDNPPKGPHDETETYTFKIQVIEKADHDLNPETDPQIITPDAKYDLVDVKGAPVLDKNKNPIKLELKNDELRLPGLDAGTYYLKETDTQNGYALLTNPIKVEIIAGTDTVTGKPDGSFTLKIDNQLITKTPPTAEEDAKNTDSYKNADKGEAVVIVNKRKGFSLPATGGMGIVIFLTIGLAGIAGISVVLMRKRRVEE